MPSKATAVVVRCGECGDAFSLSRRRELEYRRTGRPYRCHFCRSLPTPSPQAIDEDNAVFSGSRRARVLVRRWPETVSQDVADAGVERLVELMYGGDRQRIVLPPVLWAVVAGSTAH